MMSICSLLSRNDKGQWLELNKKCIVEVGNGITIREQLSNSLIADYPKPCIKCVKIVQEGSLAIVESEATFAKLAVKFKSPQDSYMFVSKLKEHLIPSQVHKNDDCLPDLKSKEAQEYIKHLLVSESFIDFIAELKEVIDSMKKIDQYELR